MRIIESQSVAKAPDRLSEDVLCCTDDFAAVFDGATSTSNKLWNGLTGGRFAATTVSHCVSSLDAEINAKEAVGEMTRVLHGAVVECGGDPSCETGPAVVAAIFSRRRREVWMVGDCHCLLVSDNGQSTHYQNEMRVDQIKAAARSLYLHSFFRGLSLDEAKLKQQELLGCDPGRSIIQPLTDIQSAFANADPECEFSYPVLNGLPIQDGGIKIIELPEDVSRIVLATDGYPDVFSTLAETESRLADVLASDPLMFRLHPATKGIQNGCVSFDDRTYLGIEI